MIWLSCSSWLNSNIKISANDAVVRLMRRGHPRVTLLHSSPPGALTKVKDCPKQESELHDRCNIISCATLAEIQHFHRTRIRDFRSQMQHHLRQQINFFQKITTKLQETLQKYDLDQ